MIDAEKRMQSRIEFERAQNAIPGGVNSPVRAYASVGGIPPFIRKGEGARIFDVDGNEYTDYVLSWGALILGHAQQTVIAAIKAAAEQGTSFGAPTVAETELAELIKDCMPHIEMLRLVNSGTEAVMTAARLARGYTGRDIIVKFDGCYHGHNDAFLVKAGSGLATGGLPASRGVPASVAQSTVSLPYNDLSPVADLLRQRHGEIAAVIVEPVAANMGVIPPAPGFLEGLRDLTQKHDIVLIFDEVITGFRVARGGASELYGVLPDLVCLGKIIGGGMPIGAVGGRREIMRLLAPAGDVYQAGTLSGNPLSVAAGLATLKELSRAGIYQQLQNITDLLASGLRRNFAHLNIPAQVNQVTGMLTVFFSTEKVNNFTLARECNTPLFHHFFHSMLNRGIYLPPSPFEAWFLSIQHRKEVIEDTLNAQISACKTMI